MLPRGLQVKGSKALAASECMRYLPLGDFNRKSLVEELEPPIPVPPQIDYLSVSFQKRTAPGLGLFTVAFLYHEVAKHR